MRIVKWKKPVYKGYILYDFNYMPNIVSSSLAIIGHILLDKICIQIFCQFFFKLRKCKLKTQETDTVSPIKILN